MRVAKFHAENFKILRVVEIIPGKGPVVIGGKNDQGKSAIMDAIWVALKGRAEADPVPIRAGEEEARIILDVGEYVVQRKFTAKEGGTFTDSLKLLDDRGRIVPQPQTVLNNLLGAIGFDPFEFTKLKDEEQAARLLELVPLSIDLEDFASEDARDYATRRDRNRDADSLEAQVRAIPEEEVPEEAPDREALTDALARAADTNGRIDREASSRDQQRENIVRRRGDADAREAEAKQMREAADKLDQDAALWRKDAAELEAALTGLPALDQPVNVEEIRGQLRDAETTLALIDRQKRRADLATRLAALRAESQAFTDAMDGREKQRREALSKAKMPVDGLGFAINEKGKPVVTYNGLPFSQAGTAVQIRASTAIAMAANPDLRILRIKDGSLLDDETMKMVADMAEADDFQLWVEVVGEGAAGIIMENGSIKAEPVKEEKKTPAKKAAAKDAGPLL